MAERFIVDTTVGKLGKWLRILGFDTAVHFGKDLHRLVQTAHRENRVIVTRNRQLEAKLFLGNIIVLKENEPDRQIAAVLRARGISLDPQHILSRCLRCNEVLKAMPSEAAEGKIPEFVFHTHETFRQCPSCQRIYWGGTHPSNMKKRIEHILELVKDRPG
jgi:hypothetical protein